ncbi:MAG: exopolysaccharide biosynthesis protein [Alphaproteobacteria bacterium]|nr:exopolysaccharide biosynthesis protein [Alphaproteobacteria bacterium]
MNIVIFMVPGLSLLFGLPMVILAVQMVLGLKTPIFPAFIRQRMISRAVLARGLELGLKGMAKVEPLIRPRLLWVSGSHMDRVHSVLALLLAVLVAFPIPILNLPPSFGVVVLALGLLQRDGLFVIASYVLAGWSLWLYGSLGQMAQRLVN